MSSTTVRVGVDIDGDMLEAGTAFFTRVAGKVTSTFTYSTDYLADPRGYELDPALPLTAGAHYVSRMPGAFGDAAPDRWGRNLISRREQQSARDAGRRPASLDDVDFLLGVSDNTRQGALRFSDNDGDVQGPDSHVPKVVALPQLLRASESVSKAEGGLAALKVLLDAGTGSLGGANPKAAIRLDDGALGIAKFPHPDDHDDTIGWEATALDLAAVAGIEVPEHRLIEVGDRAVLLERRFDRDARGSRIGYLSAMSLLERTDGDRGDYADFADRLVLATRNPTRQLRLLFDRVAFGVVIHNTDDHLRNHGLVREGDSWQLSPAFDLNPNRIPTAARQTSILGANGIDDELEALAALASECRLTPDQAAARLTHIAQAAEQWREVARANGVSERNRAEVGAVIDERIAALRGASATAPEVHLPSGRTRARRKDIGQPGNPGTFATGGRTADGR